MLMRTCLYAVFKNKHEQLILRITNNTKHLGERITNVKDINNYNLIIFVIIYGLLDWAFRSPLLGKL